MTIKYNKDKLKEIIDSICALTRLSICVIDTNFNIIYSKVKKEDAFCYKIQSTKEGANKCRCSDIKLLEECALKKSVVSHLCHAGIIDTAVPIFKSGIVVGFIIIGRVRPTKQPKAEFKSLQLKEDYKKLTYLTKSQLSGLIDLLSHILFESSITIEFDDFITKATEYIESNLDKKLSIDGLCKALFVSKNYLYSSFSSYYNCTVNEYIIQRKISVAKTMLIETKNTAFDIAKALGFDNYSYFCKLFKKHTGLSPLKYRQ